METTEPMKFSDSTELSPEILKAVAKMGFQEMTPVQQQTLPLMMEGRDVIAIAPTGTGKTCAFGIPMLEYVNLNDRRVQELVLAHREVSGIHDLVVHDYGPGRVMISLHAEVPASGSVMELHDTIDNIEQELHRKLGCEAVIHMDPIADDDGATAAVRAQVEELVNCIDPVMTLHDFRIIRGPTHTNVIFDVVVPFHFKMTDAQLRSWLDERIKQIDPSYFCVINIDKN